MRLKFGSGIVRCVQTSGVLALSVLSINPYPISAQTPASIKSPKEVLQAYRKMDAEGERLTASGWYRASKFFVKPGRRPQYRAIAVMWGEDDPYTRGPVTGNSADLWVPCSVVGQIDSAGSFTYVVAPSLIDSSGRPLKRAGTPEMHGPTVPLERGYDLVLTDTHWEFGPGGEGLREVKGPPEWRIATFEYQPWITIQAAIRYLARLRDESSSEKMKSDADKSIAILQHLLSQN